jgi:hypothetical protein
MLNEHDAPQRGTRLLIEHSVRAASKLLNLLDNARAGRSILVRMRNFVTAVRER